MNEGHTRLSLRLQYHIDDTLTARGGRVKDDGPMAKRNSNEGYADVLIGPQHGDEGKGRFIDALAANYDWVARYNGGPNAGHTIEANGHRLALHQVPSGVNYPDKKLYIGAQCVVNLEKLCQEIDELEAAGLDILHRLRIAAQASVIQPGHIIRDVQTMKSVGTTGNGIGATYADQALRVNNGRRLDVRLGELRMNPKEAFAMIRKNLEVEIETHNLTHTDIEGCIRKLEAAFDRIKHCIEKDPLLLCREIRAGMRVLLEGAQAYGLDRLHGVTPDVTSSSTGVAVAFDSTEIPVDYKRNAYAVAKLIPTRVGSGPFPTEYGGERSEEYCMTDDGKKYTKDVEWSMHGHRFHELLRSEDPLDLGIAVRMAGNEYGASTGRPRRPGALDLMQLSRTIEANGIDGIYLTKADCLNIFAQTREKIISIGTGYRINGDSIPYVPTTKEELQQVKPVIESFPSFAENISEARSIDELPPALRLLLAVIRERLDTPILAIGVGPRREQVVQWNGAIHRA